MGRSPGCLKSEKPLARQKHIPKKFAPEQCVDDAPVDSINRVRVLRSLPWDGREEVVGLAIFNAGSRDRDKQGQVKYRKGCDLYIHLYVLLCVLLDTDEAPARQG
jgi:hypothetical protein